MLASDDSPVTMIEGIGPRAEAALQQIAIYFVFDLLRASPEQIHPAVRQLASLEEVRSWRSAAVLLQVRGMTNQWAEALVEAGIATLDDFVARPVPDLRAVFVAAGTAGTIPTEPTESELWSMVVDATAIHLSGRHMGTVRGPNGPLAGVEARLGSRTRTTDARGRFRFVRVPLGVPQRLALRHPGFEIMTVDNPALHADDTIVSVRTYTLTPQAAAPAPALLSEYDGDRLPQLTENAMRSETRAADQLRARDVLVFQRRYRDGGDVLLTSKFLDHRDGRFIAVSFRVPGSQLPAGAVVGAHYMVRHGQLEPITVNPARLRAFKAQRRARRLRAGRPVPSTLAERDQALREYGRISADELGF